MTTEYDAGFADGYEAGFDEGYEQGRRAGYQDGQFDRPMQDDDAGNDDA